MFNMPDLSKLEPALDSLKQFLTAKAEADKEQTELLRSINERLLIMLDKGA